MDLEVARADRHLEPVSVTPGFLERLRDLRLAGTEEPERPPERRPAAVEHAPDRIRLERLRPEPLELGRRPRKHDDRRPVRVDDEARRRAGEPEDVSTLGHLRLLGHTLREVRVRALHPLRGHARDALDLGLELLVDPEAPGPPPWRRPRPSDRRASARGRPNRRRGRPYADRPRIGAPRARRPTTRSGRPTPSASSDRARKGPLRSVRSPRTSSLPVTTITARGRAPAWLNSRRRRRSSSRSRRRPGP